MSRAPDPVRPNLDPVDYVEGGWPNGTVRQLADSEGGDLVRYQVDQVRLFVAELIAYRERRRVSQTQVARLAGLRPGTVSELETGKTYPDWYTISRLAYALEADIRFVGRTPIRTEPVPPR